MRIDDNLEYKVDGSFACTHCGMEISQDRRDPLAKAIRYKQKSSPEQPGIHADPAIFTDRPIAIRQVFCPGCFTVLRTEIVPDDEPEYHHWRLLQV